MYDSITLLTIYIYIFYFLNSGKTTYKDSIHIFSLIVNDDRILSVHVILDSDEFSLGDCQISGELVTHRMQETSSAFLVLLCWRPWIFGSVEPP